MNMVVLLLIYLQLFIIQEHHYKHMLELQKQQLVYDQDYSNYFKCFSVSIFLLTDALTKHIAVEWGPQNIRINCLAPGPVEGTVGLNKLGYRDKIVIIPCSYYNYLH